MKKIKRGKELKVVKEPTKYGYDYAIYLENTKIGYYYEYACLNTSLNNVHIQRKYFNRDITKKDISIIYLNEYEESGETYYIARLINILTPFKNHMSKGEYEKAIEYIDNLLDNDPLNREYWLKKYDCYDKLKKYEEMEKSIDEFLELNPDSDLLWYLKGEMNIKLKKYRQSTRYLNKSLKLNPYNSSALIKKATVSIHLKKINNAITCFNKLIRLSPNKELHIKRANIYLKEKEYNKAINNYQKAYDIHKKQFEDQNYENMPENIYEKWMKNAIPWNNLAYAYLKIGEYTRCLEYCKYAIAENQNHPLSMFTLDDIIIELSYEIDEIKLLKKDLEELKNKKEE